MLLHCSDRVIVQFFVGSDARREKAVRRPNTSRACFSAILAAPTPTTTRLCQGTTFTSPVDKLLACWLEFQVRNGFPISSRPLARSPTIHAYTLAGLPTLRHHPPLRATRLPVEFLLRFLCHSSPRLALTSAFTKSFLLHQCFIRVPISSRSLLHQHFKSSFPFLHQHFKSFPSSSTAAPLTIALFRSSPPLGHRKTRSQPRACPSAVLVIGADVISVCIVAIPESIKPSSSSAFTCHGWFEAS